MILFNWPNILSLTCSVIQSIALLYCFAIFSNTILNNLRLRFLPMDQVWELWELLEAFWCLSVHVSTFVYLLCVESCRFIVVGSFVPSMQTSSVNAYFSVILSGHGYHWPVALSRIQSLLLTWDWRLQCVCHITQSSANGPQYY